MNQYVVLQVTLKEKLIGTASKNLKELEDVINAQAAKGYRLHHTITTASANSTGFGGGDRIQATMVFQGSFYIQRRIVMNEQEFEKQLNALHERVLSKALSDEEKNNDIVNIGLHFFLKDVRPMLPPVMNRSIVDA